MYNVCAVYMHVPCSTVNKPLVKDLLESPPMYMYNTGRKRASLISRVDKLERGRQREGKREGRKGGRDGAQ